MSGVVRRITTVAMAVIASMAATACSAQTLAQGEGEHWHWGHTTDADARRLVMTTVRSAIPGRDFARLDALETAYRGPAGTTISGSSLLDFFYEVLAFEVRRAPDAAPCEADGAATLDLWRKASPRSPAPVIAMAALLEQRGWCYRGPGRAGTVAPDAWRPFRENIAAALTLMESVPAAAMDPHYFVRLIHLYA